MVEQILSRNSISDLENSNKLFSFTLTLCVILNFLIMFDFIKKDSEKIHFNEVTSKLTSVKVTLAPPQLKVEKTKPIVKKSFKKKIVKKQILKEDQVKTQTVSKQRKMTKQGQNSLIAKYIKNVRDMINKEKVYPRMAKRLRQQGKVKIEIVIGRTGEIINLKYLTKTKFEILNKAVENIFEKIKNFEVIPKGITEKTLTVGIPIVFELI